VRYVYAVLWIAIFGGLGWQVYVGAAEHYQARRGRVLAEMLTVVSEKFGRLPVALLCVAIGLGFAAWSIWGREEDDEPAAP
jgi:hypothetical protein